MRIRDEAFVGALGRADGAPDLREGDRGEARSQGGHEMARLALCPPAEEELPPAGSRTPRSQEGLPCGPERSNGLVCAHCPPL